MNIKWMIIFTHKKFEKSTDENFDKNEREEEKTKLIFYVYTYNTYRVCIMERTQHQQQQYSQRTLR